MHLPLSGSQVLRIGVRPAGVPDPYPPPGVPSPRLTRGPCGLLPPVQVTRGPSLSGYCCDRGSFPVALRRKLQSEKGKPASAVLTQGPAASVSSSVILPTFLLLGDAFLIDSLFFALISLCRFESILMTLQKLLLYILGNSSISCSAHPMLQTGLSHGACHFV